METLATLLTAILTGMRAALAPHVNRDRARTAILLCAWTRIGRAASRFQALFARWQANTLPTPRQTRAARKTPSAAKPHFPAGRAWLAGTTDHHVRGHASQLQHLLDHPDMPKFLAAAPQAGRILRPLCHMLGITMPAVLLPLSRAKPEGAPSRPKPAKPPRPKPAPLPPLRPLYPQRRPRPMPFMNFSKKAAPA